MAAFYSKLLLTLFLLTGTARWVAANDGEQEPTTTPSKAQLSAEKKREAQERLTALKRMLKDSDTRKQDEAIQEIYTEAESAIGSKKAAILQTLVDTGHFDVANQFAIEFSIRWAGNVWAVERLTELRAKSFLRQKKYPEALSAAKSYYNVCHLNNTPNAITLLCLCLVEGDPNKNADRVNRFKNQQVAWSNAKTAYTPRDPNLGAPILDEIILNDADLLAAAKELPETTYVQIIRKANLLLAAGDVETAEPLCELAFRIAVPKSQSEAIELNARMLRAKDGALNVANAYLSKVQN